MADDTKTGTEVHLKLVDSMMPLAPVSERAPDQKEFVGRTNPAPFSLQKLAKQHTEKAIETILEIMNDPEQEGSTRLEAAKQILDRGWGKPAVNIKQETIKYTLADIEKKLLQDKDYIDERMEEARRIESERLGRYITVDAEVVTDVTADSEGSLPDNA